MDVGKSMLLASMVAGAALLSGCGFLAGTAVGAAGGYEYQNRERMDQLEKDYEAGRISREEYEKRKEEIEERSVAY
ncbi:MAG: hypothetical protein WC383_15945 [Gammaproteobacteria bacterium]